MVQQPRQRRRAQRRQVSYPPTTGGQPSLPGAYQRFRAAHLDWRAKIVEQILKLPELSISQLASWKGPRLCLECELLSLKLANIDLGLPRC